MFEYCPFIHRECGFAGYVGWNLHCGLQTGSLDETNVDNMKSCPKDKKKRKRRR
mgnify:CR=1 FL=1